VQAGTWLEDRFVIELREFATSKWREPGAMALTIYP
jgi:hypothetical protein